MDYGHKEQELLDSNLTSLKPRSNVSNRKCMVITFTALYLWARAVHRLYKRQQPSKTLRARAISESVEGLVILIGSVPKI